MARGYQLHRISTILRVQLPPGSRLSLVAEYQGRRDQFLSIVSLHFIPFQCSCLCETDDHSDQVTHARCPECVSLVSEGTGHHYRAADVSWPGHLLSVSLCISRLFWPGVISDLCCRHIYCRQRVTSHIAIFLSLHL